MLSDNSKRLASDGTIQHKVTLFLTIFLLQIIHFSGLNLLRRSDHWGPMVIGEVSLDISAFVYVA